MTHVSPRIRALIVFLACVLALGLSSTALAQDPPGPEDGGDEEECRLDPITCAADAVGQNLNERSDEGDCSEGGPEACLGLLLRTLMCAIDNREITQTACGPQKSTAADETHAVTVSGDRGGRGVLALVINMSLGTEVARLTHEGMEIYTLVLVGSRDARSGRVFQIEARNARSGRTRMVLVGSTASGDVAAVDRAWLRRRARG